MTKRKLIHGDKNDIIYVWNNMNLSLFTEFCINKEGLWLPVSEDSKPHPHPHLLTFPHTSSLLPSHTPHTTLITPWPTPHFCLCGTCSQQAKKAPGTSSLVTFLLWLSHIIFTTSHVAWSIWFLQLQEPTVHNFQLCMMVSLQKGLLPGKLRSQFSASLKILGWKTQCF